MKKPDTTGFSKELLDGQWVLLQIPNCMHDWTLGSLEKLLLLLENERRVQTFKMIYPWQKD
jgi:hypothetical protein